jgi:uncharacterized protein YyaL (SSP411 family)
MNGRTISPPNGLQSESSPYLRSHAHQPVDWHPWGTAALECARHEDKPILLSIGYAACHWCHVMAHESFEDAATAALMNERFVNIKVDREQRPDLDRLYQLAQQLLTGRGGGWPLTMFLLPEDQRPFFGGTYFPPLARFGLPAFRDLLRQVADYYRTHGAQLRASAQQVVAALADLNPGPVAAAVLDEGPLHEARRRLEQRFDREWGGFGAAPKFPHPAGIDRLLRAWYQSADRAEPDLQALFMAGLTLTRMAEGGLFDQLGGGFFRYSVDERWEIPHFEKMLYDNAQLLRVYAAAAAATGEPLFAASAHRTAAWLLRELCSPDGAFYGSLDADSEGHEGRYYLWSAADVRAALTAPEWSALAARYGLEAPANFEGQWHLRVHAAPAQIAAALCCTPGQAQEALDRASAKLLALRAARTPPALDDQVLCSWNALAIGALASAARLLDHAPYAEAATRALGYLRRVHWVHGRLLACSVDGQARLGAYLDDYAFLLDALLELAAVRFDASELAWAIELADALLRHFEDAAVGGFCFTADDHEALIARPKSFSDEALPAGNALAARALLRLGLLLGEGRYLAAAERTLQACWPALQKYPDAHASMLLALEDWLEPPQLVLLRGPAAAVESWHRVLRVGFAPRVWVLAVPADAAPLPPALALRVAGESVRAWLCCGSTCSAPFSALAELLAALRPASAPEPEPPHSP